MSDNRQPDSRPLVLRPLVGIAGLGGRAAAGTLKPLGGVIESALDDERLQAAVQRALAGEGATRMLDLLFESGIIDRFLTHLVDSGTLDRFLERLLTSQGLWDVVDEVAASPAVTAAISQQGLGFADQVGDEVRGRSRKADAWMERTARRLIHRTPAPEPDPGTS